MFISPWNPWKKKVGGECAQDLTSRKFIITLFIREGNYNFECPTIIVVIREIIMRVITSYLLCISTVLRTLHILMHLILAVILHGKNYYHPYLWMSKLQYREVN